MNSPNKEWIQRQIAVTKEREVKNNLSPSQHEVLNSFVVRISSASQQSSKNAEVPNSVPSPDKKTPQTA